jgi:hypothetical protein
VTIYRELSKLKDRLYQTAQAFSTAGARYYGARRADSSSLETRDAAEGYRLAAIPYQTALDDCEIYLHCVARDAEMESDLRHILVFKHSLTVILNNLDRKKVSNN